MNNIERRDRELPYIADREVLEAISGLPEAFT